MDQLVFKECFAGKLLDMADTKELCRIRLSDKIHVYAVVGVVDVVGVVVGVM